MFTSEDFSTIRSPIFRVKRMRRSLLTFFWLLLFSPAARGADDQNPKPNPCTVPLVAAANAPEVQFAPNLGSAHAALPYFPNETVTLLGRGNAGTVYRLTDLQGVVRVVKVYRDYKKGYDRDTGWAVNFPAADLRNSDVNVLTLLRLAQRSGRFPDCAIPEVTSLTLEGGAKPEHAMGVSLVEGRDVVSLLADETLSPEFKTDIYNRYV